jgi:hypothetical protein
MKRNIGLRTIAITVLAMALASVVPLANAQECSSTDASGKYAFSDHGTVVDVGPRAAVGLLTFRSSGKVEGPVTASLNGNITQTTLSGTYAVNPDCSGTATFGEYDSSGNLILTATVAIAWDAGMREARFLFTSVVLANGPSLSIAIDGDARKLGATQE